MSLYDTVYGNGSLKAVISGFASKRAFPNALIISGETGSGKSLIASVIASAIACESENGRPCGLCSACRKISKGISPDVITVGTVGERKTIGVDTVRELRESAYILPNDLSVKIYIIDQAERLTAQAQNALLKIFEEGPPSVYFLLLTSSPTSLLPTVRSRAPELRTELFSESDLETLLRENKKASDLKKRDPVAYNRLISASNGSYGRALSILEGKNKKELRTYTKAEELLTALSEENDASLMTGLLSESTDRENYCGILRLMQTGVRDMILIKKGENAASLRLFADENTAYELSRRFSLRSLISISSALNELSQAASETNINLRNAAIVAFNTLKERK